MNIIWNDSFNFPILCAQVCVIWDDVRFLLVSLDKSPKSD